MEKNFTNFKDNSLALLLRENYEPAVFNELASRYRERIKSQCELLVKNKEIAEDLTQEVLIKLFMKIKAFKAESEFSTWIFSITHNTCIDYIRANNKVLYQNLSKKLTESLVEEIEEIDSFDLNMEDFERLLEELEEETRTILILRYKQNLSLKNIQEQLNLGESAIKMRLKRAREKARNVVKNKK